MEVQHREWLLAPAVQKDGSFCVKKAPSSEGRQEDEEQSDDDEKGDATQKHSIGIVQSRFLFFSPSSALIERTGQVNANIYRDVRSSNAILLPSPPSSVLRSVQMEEDEEKKALEAIEAPRECVVQQA